MTAVAERTKPALPARAEQSPADMVAVIAAAAKDPSIDVNKLERLLDMHLKLKALDAEKDFNVAMATCQAEVGRVAPDADNNQTRSKYATYAALDRVLRPVYTRNGFALSFGEAACEKPETVRVTCIVSHIGGHSRTYHRDMPADGKGAKGGDVMTKTHAAGAAGSYGARYLLKGIFNVAIGELDDDGNGATGTLMEERVLADHLAAIDSTSDADSLLTAYTKAYKAAQLLKDRAAMRLIGQHKDARKKALGL